MKRNTSFPVWYWYWTGGRSFLLYTTPKPPPTTLTTLSLLYIPLPCIPSGYGYCVFSENYICEQYLVTCRKCRDSFEVALETEGFIIFVWEEFVLFERIRVCAVC